MATRQTRFLLLDHKSKRLRFFLMLLLKSRCFFFFLFGLMLNVLVNNFSVMLGQSHCFLGITSTFLGGRYVLLKDTTRGPEWGSNLWIQSPRCYPPGLTASRRCFYIGNLLPFDTFLVIMSTVLNLITLSPTKGSSQKLLHIIYRVQRRMISVDNFFVFLRFLFFALSLLYVT